MKITDVAKIKRGFGGVILTVNIIILLIILSSCCICPREVPVDGFDLKEGHGVWE